MSGLRIAGIMRALPGASGRGGVSYQVHHLSERLVRLGHEVTLFAADPAPPGATYAVRTLFADEARKQRRAFIYLEFPRLVARQDFRGFDVIHAHGDDAFLGRGPVPRVRTFWGSDLGEAFADRNPAAIAGHLWGYGLEIVAGRGADRAVGISAATRRYLPFVRDIVPPGVDLELFRPDTREKGKKSAAPSILFVSGSLHGRKRGQLLIDAFLGPVRAAVPDAELWLVCPERAEGPGIRWLGTLAPDAAGMTELARLYRQAWVFCSPSRHEGFGIPYVEAMASGTAVVATPNPGALEVLRGGDLGVVASPRGLGQALVSVLGSEPLRAALVARALAEVGRYSLDRVAAEYERILTEVVEGRRRVGG